MRLIDGEKLWDELIAQGVMSKEDAIKIISRQQTIDAIPVDFARDLLEACEDEGYRHYRAGIRQLIKEWHKENR